MKKDLTKACGSCPFKRINNNQKPNPGGSPVETYLGQIRGPFWLPCHKDKNYEAKDSDPLTVQQCAGAAIFRSNCGRAYRLPEQLLDLPANKQDVFANEAEFYAHYKGIPESIVKDHLTPQMLDEFMRREMMDHQVKQLT